jgi:hypothetical protein
MTRFGGTQTPSPKQNEKTNNLSYSNMQLDQKQNGNFSHFAMGLFFQIFRFIQKAILLHHSTSCKHKKCL